MQLGVIGLGRMGGNISRRLMRDGHTTVVYDRAEPAVADLVKDGSVGAKDLADLKLGEEYERSDAQVYLIRLELSVTKKRLADALARCGAACAPPAH